MTTQKITPCFFEEYKKKNLIKKVDNFFKSTEADERLIGFGIVYSYFLNFETPLVFIDNCENLPLFFDFSEHTQGQLKNMEIHAKFLKNYFDTNVTFQNYLKFSVIIYKKESIKNIVDDMKKEWINFKEIFDKLESEN